MTLDDETAARIAREIIGGGKAARVYPHSTDVALVRAGYAARDAEVEELRARLAKVRAVYDAWFLHESEMWVDLLLSDISDALDESPTERETPAAESSEEVIVRDSIFRRDELPEVLGRMIDARDEAAREAKNYYLRLQDAEATLMELKPDPDPRDAAVAAVVAAWAGMRDNVEFGPHVAVLTHALDDLVEFHGEVVPDDRA